MAQAVHSPEVPAGHRLSPCGDARGPPVGCHREDRAPHHPYPTDRLPAAELLVEQPPTADTNTTIFPTRGEEKRLLVGQNKLKPLTILHTTTN